MFKKGFKRDVLRACLRPDSGHAFVKQSPWLQVNDIASSVSCLIPMTLSGLFFGQSLFNFLKQCWPHYQLFCAFNSYLSRPHASRFPNLFYKAVRNRYFATRAHFGKPGRQSSCLAQTFFVGLSLRFTTAQDDVAPGRAANMKPEVVGVTDSEGQIVVALVILTN